MVEDATCSSLVLGYGQVTEKARNRFLSLGFNLFFDFGLSAISRRTESFLAEELGTGISEICDVGGVVPDDQEVWFIPRRGAVPERGTRPPRCEIACNPTETMSVAELNTHDTIVDFASKAYEVIMCEFYLNAINLLERARRADEPFADTLVPDGHVVLCARGPVKCVVYEDVLALRDEEGRCVVYDPAFLKVGRPSYRVFTTDELKKLRVGIVAAVETSMAWVGTDKNTVWVC